MLKRIVCLTGIFMLASCAAQRQFSLDEQEWLNKMRIFRKEQRSDLSRCQFVKPAMAHIPSGSLLSDHDPAYEKALQKIKLKALDSRSDTIMIETIRFPIKSNPPISTDSHVIVKASLFRCGMMTEY